MKTKRQKLLSGTYRPDQHKEKTSVDFGLLTSIPPPPKWLNTIGKGYFQELAGIMFQAGTLQNSDLHLLALLCSEMARYRDAASKLEEQGQVIVLKNGYPKANEFIKIAEKSFSGACELGTRFGLDLAGRAKIPEMMKPVKIEWHEIISRVDPAFWEKNFGHLTNKDLLQLSEGLKEYVSDRERMGKDVEPKR